jgi:hypothetical protein
MYHLAGAALARGDALDGLADLVLAVLVVDPDGPDSLDGLDAHRTRGIIGATLGDSEPPGDFGKGEECWCYHDRKTFKKEKTAGVSFALRRNRADGLLSAQLVYHAKAINGITS